MRAIWILLLIGCSGNDNSGTTLPDGSPDATPDAAADATRDAAPDAAVDPCTLADWDEGIPFSSGLSASEETACALRGLDSAFEGQRIVCSGEDSHGVGEANLLHVSIARHLILERGFRTVSMEFDRASAASWNQFIQTGDEAFLERGFIDAAGLSNSRSSEAFVRDLRSIALELPLGETLLLTGYDVAVGASSTRSALVSFLRITEPATANDWRLRLSDDADALNAVIELRELLTARRDEHIALAGLEATEDAETDAANLYDGLQFIAYFRAGDFNTGNATHREPGMTRNVMATLARRPGGLLLTSHNQHCGRDIDIGQAADGTMTPSLGRSIALSEYGTEFLVLHQLYASGAEVLPSAGFPTRAFQAPPTSLEATLGQTLEGEIWLLSNAHTVIEDRTWTSRYGIPFSPKTRADGYVWLRVTTPILLRE
ncbi:MAG: erythromycin esterase family protein [Myxococcota bacterium]